MRPAKRLACHIHTEWSFDGSWSLARIARALRRRGYDGMLTAEHVQSLDEASWRAYQEACRRVSTPDFLVMPGVEYRDAAGRVHVPVWGDLPLLGDGLPISALLAEVEREGGTALLAHPTRHSSIEEFDPAWSEKICGIEVWNRKYDGWAPNPAALAMARKWDVAAFASLDFHGRRQFFPLAMTCSADGPLTCDDVLGALRHRELRPTFLHRSVDCWTGPRAMSLLVGLERARRRLAPYSHRPKRLESRS